MAAWAVAASTAITERSPPPSHSATLRTSLARPAICSSRTWVASRASRGTRVSIQRASRAFHTHLEVLFQRGRVARERAAHGGNQRGQFGHGVHRHLPAAAVALEGDGVALHRHALGQGLQRLAREAVGRDEAQHAAGAQRAVDAGDKTLFGEARLAALVARQFGRQRRQVEAGRAGQAGLGQQARASTWRRAPRQSMQGFFTPVVVEVEPVVGRLAAQGFQPRHVVEQVQRGSGVRARPDRTAAG
jgi:hypothetical protein